jgi:hypothetical protein
MQDQHLANLSMESAELAIAEDSTSPVTQQGTSEFINTSLRQALPRLRDIALYAALVGPIIVDKYQIDSLGHPGGC